tara:strand:- start:560 stop:895 length:336 start_codon:yes stop_codon:yes gene_type:complete
VQGGGGDEAPLLALLASLPATRPAHVLAAATEALSPRAAAASALRVSPTATLRFVWLYVNELEMGAVRPRPSKVAAAMAGHRKLMRLGSVGLLGTAAAAGHRRLIQRRPKA